MAEDIRKGHNSDPDCRPRPTRSIPVAQRHSYISRHWHGELPLGITYWVNGCLVSVAVAIAADALSALGATDITRAPRLISAGYAALTSFVAIVSIWQLVGIWRSAGHRIEQHRALGKGNFWPFAARIATVFGFILLTVNTLAYRFPSALGYLEIAFGEHAIPHHILRVLNGGSEIELAGGIDWGTAADFEVLLSATPNARTVDLDSIGGRVAEAERIARLIRGKHLATYTAGSCASACMIAYMAGYPRYLGPGGSLGFHRYSFPGLTPAQKDAVNLRAEQELMSEGVTQSFADEAFSTPSGSIWVPSAEALLAAGVVTNEINGMTFSAAAAGVGQPLTSDRAAKILEAIPSFAVLRRADPNAFSRSVTALARGVGDGEAAEDVIRQTQAPLSEAFSKARLVAGDNAQRQLVALGSEEAKLLAPMHPNICLAILNGASYNGPQYSTFLPVDLQARDAEITGAVIESGFYHPSYEVASAATANAEIAWIWAQVRREGFDTSAVGTRTTTVEQERSACLAIAAFLATVARLPARTAGPLMRYLDRNP